MLTGYLARLAQTAVGSTLRSRVPLLGEARLPSRVWPTDIDPYLHVNNGRYLTLMDFARFDHALRTGLFKVATRHKWFPVAASSSVQFRRELKPFQAYEITTRLADWDSKWLWVEHRFERQGAVHTWAGIRIVFRHQGRSIPPADVLAAAGEPDAKPSPSEQLSRWSASEQR
ncbi:MAG: thioesterase family protein [Myxococcota bacterium]|nr:thioesterase family protein [Myxococcota bacterium]